MNRTVTVAPSRPRLIVHFMSSPRECRDGGSRATASKKKSPIKDIVIEPKAGGRWYERGEGRRATVIASLNAATQLPAAVIHSPAEIAAKQGDEYSESPYCRHGQCNEKYQAGSSG